MMAGVPRTLSQGTTECRWGTVAFGLRTGKARPIVRELCHWNNNLLEECASHVEASFEGAAAEDARLWNPVPAERHPKALVFWCRSSSNHAECCASACRVSESGEVEGFREGAVRIAKSRCSERRDNLIFAREDADRAHPDVFPHHKGGGGLAAHDRIVGVLPVQRAGPVEVGEQQLRARGEVCKR